MRDGGGALPLEDGDAGREAVQEIAVPDRSDLTRAERAGERHRAQHVLYERRVVVGRGEELAAPAVAREQQRRVAALVGEQLAQVVVGGLRVTYLELHGRPDVDAVADRDGA